MKHPNFNILASEKFQNPNPNVQGAHWFAAWSLGLLWMLGLGIWSFLFLA